MLCRNIAYDAAQYLELITPALVDAGGYELDIECNLPQAALDDLDHVFCILGRDLFAEPSVP